MKTIDTIIEVLKRKGINVKKVKIKRINHLYWNFSQNKDSYK
ncbi:hypothetical protein [Bacillus sp. SA1-12]|nr:hypothetical protein [Bacillus sp. SA1-12]